MGAVNALLLALLLTGTDEAARRPTLVKVDLAQGCPADLFERALVFRTDRVALVAAEADATAFIEVAVTARGKRFDGQLRVRADGLATSKKLSGPKCETVIGALSLAAALVLDPEGARTGPLPPEGPPPAPPPEPVVVAPPEPAAPPAPEPAPEPTPPPAPVIVEAPPAPAPLQPGLRPELSAFARGVLTTGLSNQPDFGGGASLEVALAAPLTLPSFVGRLSVAGVGGRTITNDQGSVEYLAHLAAELSAGAGLELGVLRPELGLAAQLTPVLLRGVGADEVSSSQRWLWALGPEARLTLKLGPWRVALGAALTANLRRERYVIDPNGVVLTVPDWFVSGGLELGRTFL